jgi:arylsulfatase A-like enzyme
MNGRDLSGMLCGACIATGLAPSFTFAMEAKPGGSAVRPPNVVLILADDLGYGDLSIMGQRKLKTPNIDRIGREGVVFSNYYCGNTVSSPSRASLMTGQHPGHVHCRSNADNGIYEHLDPAMVTLPRLFKNAGYETGAFGKWGLGTTIETGPANPMTHGFDVFTGWRSQMTAHTYFPTNIVRNGKQEPLPPGTFVHDLIMKDAFSFIREKAKSGKPFFAYIPTAVPHAAMHAPKELHEKWRKVYPEFDSKVGTYDAGSEPCPPVTNPIAGFAAMMENLDNQVGELLAMLKELGVEDNTLILFMTDNGPHLEGGHDPLFWDSNGPLRGFKRDFYEGGIRSPFLARWPAGIKAGSRSDHISAFWDILPTMAELTGQPVPAQSDGISILPTLQGQTERQKNHDYLYWEFSTAGIGIRRAAIRQGNWKGVHVYHKGKKTPQPLELFDLATDPGEEKNIAEEHRDIVARLEQLMKQAHIPQEDSVRKPVRQTGRAMPEGGPVSGGNS